MLGISKLPSGSYVIPACLTLPLSKMEKNTKRKTSNESSTIKKNSVKHKNEIINVSLTTIAMRKKSCTYQNIVPTKLNRKNK